MAAFDLRPLTLREILCRAFGLYRQHFKVFVGIAALPELLGLAANLAQLLLERPDAFGGIRRAPPTAVALTWSLVLILASIVAYVVAQGAVFRAVTDLYMGRPASVNSSITFVLRKLGKLFKVGILSGLAVAGSMLLLIVPGIYVLTRLLVCVPATLTEGLGPLDSLYRSWGLTKGSAGRGFMIILLCFIVMFAATILLVGPFVGLAAVAGLKNPAAQRLWLVLVNISLSLVTALVGPILLIATSLFYFDLRIRKEAFDLH